MASASSAAIGSLSPLVPSTLAQKMSTSRFDIMHSTKTLDEKLAALGDPDTAIAALYDMSILDKLSACSEYPSKCDEKGGRFVDGGVVDSPTMALNIAQYQRDTKADIWQPLKMFVTLDGTTAHPPSAFLAYFNTTFNYDLQPGEYLWPFKETRSSYWIPSLSPQVFDKKLDGKDFEKAMLPLDGTNVTTAIFHGTTIENPCFSRSCRLTH